MPYDPTVARLQEIVSGYPGITRDLLTYLRERIKEVLTGASASIVVRIYGPDLEQLSSTANRVAAAIRPLQGVANLNVQQQIMIPQIAITYRPEAAASLGLGPQDLRRVTDVLLTGQRVGQVYESQKIFDVVVRGTPQFSRDVDAIRNLVIDTPQGGAVAIRDVADVGIVPTPNVITREAASRRIDVTLNAGEGRPLSELATEVKAAVGQVSFDQGYYAEVLGEFAELEAARNRLFIASAISVLGIFFILQALFGSTRKASADVPGPAGCIGRRRRSPPISDRARCRWVRSSASSRFWALRYATASCSSATTATSKPRKACRSVRIWCCAVRKSGLLRY